MKKAVKAVKGMIKNNRAKAIVVMMAFVTLIACFFAFFIVHASKSNSVVAFVNGEPLTTEEFRFSFDDNISQVYNYFKQKYGADDSKDFWTTTHNNEVPIEILRKKALDECIEIKVQQILGKEKGVIPDISFAAFLTGLDRENKRRDEAVKKNEPIYGPRQYDAKTYYSVTFNNMVNQIKKKMSDETAVSDVNLKDIYEKNKDKYKNPDSVSVEMLTMNDTAGTSNDAKNNKDSALNLMQGILNSVNNGEELGKAAESFANGTSYNVKYSTETLSSMKLRWPENKQLFDSAQRLSVGQISGLVEIGDNIVILKCIGKKDGGYQSFDEIKDGLKSIYVDQQYRSLVDKLVKEADVTINDSVYKKIFVK